MISARNILLLFLLSLISVHCFCPNKCNGNGICETAHGARSCFCFPGFVGPDCSTKACPAGIAWVDYPQETDVAHSDFTECSNMGKCNRETGDCECRKGFTGAACDQSKSNEIRCHYSYMSLTCICINSPTLLC